MRRSTKRFRSKILRWIGRVDMTVLKAQKYQSAGQNHVFPRTVPLTRSARSVATAVPIGAPPVLAHDREPVQAQPIDRLPDGSHVFLDGVAVGLWSIGQPEAEVVHGDAAESIPQASDDASIEEAPRRIPVTEQDRCSRALIHVVHPSR
jgi:hypothetical protein